MKKQLYINKNNQYLTNEVKSYIIAIKEQAMLWNILFLHKASN